MFAEAAEITPEVRVDPAPGCEVVKPSKIARPSRSFFRSIAFCASPPVFAQTFLLIRFAVRSVMIVCTLMTVGVSEKIESESCCGLSSTVVSVIGVAVSCARVISFHERPTPSPSVTLSATPVITRPYSRVTRADCRTLGRESARL